MGTTFWVRRFAQVFVAALVVIAGAQRIKGRTWPDALAQGLVSGAMAAGIFTVSRIYQSRRGMHCALCRDTPELARVKRAPADAGNPDT